MCAFLTFHAINPPAQIHPRASAKIYFICWVCVCVRVLHTLAIAAYIQNGMFSSIYCLLMSRMVLFFSPVCCIYANWMLNCNTNYEMASASRKNYFQYFFFCFRWFRIAVFSISSKYYNNGSCFQQISAVHMFGSRKILMSKMNHFNRMDIVLLCELIDKWMIIFIFML